MSQPDDIILTIEELSEYLKIPKSTIYKLVNENQIPGAKKVGRHWRFLKSTIDSWMQEGSNSDEGNTDS